MFFVNLDMQKNNLEDVGNLMSKIINTSLKSLFNFVVVTTGEDINNFEIDKKIKDIYLNSMKIIFKPKKTYEENELYNIIFNFAEMQKEIYMDENPSSQIKSVSEEIGLSFKNAEKLNSEIDFSKPNLSIIYTIYEIMQDNISNFRTYDSYTHLFDITVKGNRLYIDNNSISINENVNTIISFCMNNISIPEEQEQEFLFNDRIPDISFFSETNMKKNRLLVEEYKINVFNKLKNLTAEEWAKLNPMIAKYLAENEYIPLSILKA